MENQSIPISGLGLFVFLLVVSVQMLELSLIGKPGPGGAGSSALMFIMAKLSFPRHPGGKGQIILKKKYVGSEWDTPKGKFGRNGGRKGRFFRDHSCHQQMENEISSFAFWDRGSNQTLIPAQLWFPWGGTGAPLP